MEAIVNTGMEMKIGDDIIVKGSDLIGYKQITSLRTPDDFLIDGQIVNLSLQPRDLEGYDLEEFEKSEYIRNINQLIEFHIVASPAGKGLVNVKNVKPVDEIEPERLANHEHDSGATTDEIPVEVEELHIPQLPKDLRTRILEMRRSSMLEDYLRIPTIDGIITLSGHPVDIMVFSKKLKSATEIACYIEGHRIEVTINRNKHHHLLVPHCKDDGTRIIDADYRLYMSWANIMENHINKFTNLPNVTLIKLNKNDETKFDFLSKIE